jgi:hypothetical protein
VRGRYPQHAWLDAIFKPPLEDVTRDFTWRAEDGYLYVRSPNRRPGYWQEVEIPPVGTQIQFKLDAHVRRNNLPGTSTSRLVARNRAVVDPKANIAWLHRQANKMGLHIERSTFASQPELIEKLERPFLMYASVFEGIATVTDEESFTAKLTTGVGNAKAYGFGFLAFQPI